MRKSGAAAVQKAAAATAARAGLALPTVGAVKREPVMKIGVSSSHATCKSALAASSAWYAAARGPSRGAKSRQARGVALRSAARRAVTRRASAVLKVACVLSALHAASFASNTLGTTVAPAEVFAVAADALVALGNVIARQPGGRFHNAPRSRAPVAGAGRRNVGPMEGAGTRAVRIAIVRTNTSRRDRAKLFRADTPRPGWRVQRVNMSHLRAGCIESDV